MGTDDESLIRIVVSRSEVDLVEIRAAFVAKYEKTLGKMIEVGCCTHARTHTHATNTILELFKKNSRMV